MWPGIPRSFIAAAVVMACMAGSAPAQDSVEPFFRGKTLNLYVGSSAGGGYDTYARLLARHIGNHIPGNPTVVVQNMPGAGSNKAAGFVYSVAPKDGTAIGAIFPGAILQPLLGDAPVQHEPGKFNYLGSANSEVYLCLMRSDAPVKRFQDVLTREVIVGASNEGGTTRDLPAMMNNVLGTKFRIVTGYPGSRQITLAIDRNEVHGACGIGWTGLPTLYPHWFERKLVTILVQASVKGHPDLKRMGVPAALDFAKSTEDRQVMELVFSQGLFGRPYVLPPGAPPDRVAALRKAFSATLQDKALLAEAQKMKLDLDLVAGDDLQATVTKLFELPAATVSKAKQSLVYKPAQ
jgi:tripartite-type tricarboxylate transporter receptor subunit TctC